MSRAAPGAALGSRRAAARGAMPALAIVAAVALPARADVAAAVRVDSLLETRAPDARRELERWAKSAGLAELLWVARRAGTAPRPLDALVLERALARADGRRGALRASLLRQLARLDGPRAKQWLGKLPPSDALERTPRDGSPWRVAALLPREGPRAMQAEAVRRGLADALAGRAGLRLEAFAATTPGEALAAGGSLVAGLAAEEHPALVALQDLMRLPAIAPVGPPAAHAGIHAVEPSAFERGARLAAALGELRGRRVALLASAVADSHALVHGFRRAALARGAVIAWEGTFTPRAADFRPVVAALGEAGAEIVLFDGEASDADPLLRQLSQARRRVQLAGGEAFDPAHQHASLRPLLEGARWVAADWRLPPADERRLAAARGPGTVQDTVHADEVPVPGAVAPAAHLAALPPDEARAFEIRGWLAGRFLADAVAGGALHAGEIGAFLTRWSSSAPDERPPGYLPAPVYGARLPVYEVRRGANEPLP